MLGLQFKTPTSWVEVAKGGLPQVLTDHAFAEQKAAANAMAIIFSYPEQTQLVKAMSDVAIEEMEHFKKVHQLMTERGITLGHGQKNDYAISLQKFFPKQKNSSNTLVHKLLVSALIEARSCERFKVFSENIGDAELAIFYHDLMISEANHYTLFLGFARGYGDLKTVNEKWDALLAFEATLMQDRGTKATVHG